ncbi:hypothetical protein CC85DRAFT_38720 [Cutaneotrichosporon oleaginosum]|uniref:Uncharacterized protein n=1 Tax=Cutaneotrichosporon oleaginosum TaxID=879819 RepID=A0A0J0XB38_9TREE|nr:uncharacterized protein CC85DRAFT_38720 [Cutaneotrichosporon oleaginosum]KLT38322.1 hypothetical protein CC85DRAFT_38720 [Cutaneotrichosporon oleaginosum]TXT12752.1 hypothetical protein COLE_03162 [Cutaneotrichosporon oleaginosum]
MRLSQANKILLGSCLVVVPLSFYGGLAIKEHYLAGELDKVPESKDLVSERAVKARIVQCVGGGMSVDRRLEQERKELMVEGRDLDKKIAEIKARLAAKSCRLRGRATLK